MDDLFASPIVRYFFISLLALVVVFAVERGVRAILRRRRLFRQDGMCEVEDVPLDVLRSLVDGSEDIVLLYDTQGRCLYGNSATRAALESSRQAGKTLYEYYDPLNAAHMINQIKQVAGSGDAMRVENCLFWRGQRRWFIDQIMPIKSRTGKVDLVIKLSREITDRKSAEQAYKESQERFTSIYDESPIAIQLFDVQGKLVSANEAAVNLFGVVDPQELVGMSLFDDPNLPRDLLARVSSGEPERFEVAYDFQRVVDRATFRTSKSGLIYIDMLITPKMNRERGRPDGYLLQAQNITWQKMTEQALRDSEEMFRTLVENQGEGMTIIDLTQRIVFSNPVAEEIFGVPAGTLVGRSLRDFTSTEQFRVVEAFSNLREEKDRSTCEVEITRPDGVTRNLLITATPWFEPHKVFAGTLTILHDITERKQMEEALKYLSSHDKLTGLYNRAYFDEELSRLQMSRKFPVSVIMVDVDGLKATNDQLGHAAGDDLLKRAATVLKICFRADDVVARIGGDEFCVLLPQTDSAGADDAVRRLRNRLSENNVSLPDRSIQMSVGRATAKVALTLMDVLRTADRDMYRDKQSHRAGVTNRLS